MSRAGRTERTAAVAVAAFVLLYPGSAKAQPVEACLDCHADPSIFEGMERAEALVLAPEVFAASIHGQLELACVDCHTALAGVEVGLHDAPLPPASCADCHAETEQEWRGSIHGYAFAQQAGRDGGRPAPGCASCHGTHDIQPSSEPESHTHRTRLVETCGTCHGETGQRTTDRVRLARVVDAYADSVHGRDALAGGEDVAICTDCHGVHDLRGAADAESRIHHSNVARTCGACHARAAEEYGGSIHGRALAAGIGDSPTCTDCHGEHHILSPSGPEASTHARNVATQTCGSCHDDPAIIEKYGLRSGVVGSYADSYHGWATARDFEAAATCVSCHTAHAVLPASDPDSPVAPERVAATCGKCHPGADAAFAASYTHESASISANPINRWIRRFYLTLIVVVIGGMVVHNLLILAWFARRRRQSERSAPQVVRLSPWEREQHALLALSFVGLVVTGFALRFPEAWWAQELARLGMDEPVRQDLHRGFGLILTALGIAHLAWTLLWRGGRAALVAMLPRPEDLREALTQLRFHLGLESAPARFGRFDYTQKAEYWAVAWGTALMAVTGLVLWFPQIAVRAVPSWSVPAAQTIHYYEAWLAALAIVVWHLFFVVFHPDVWPMSWTWLTGRMSEHEVRERHPRWHEELAERRQDSGPA